ncbi:GntR family transcriptional regulator [Neobacillus novalis]|uniref:GntR family transcriptional regulator n=1 Tax=Neobacillus novalis TaxID=220687 RepID=A0AA95MRH6_9BACI|nr:GntR family transcriptional regulator [Neobacillus novalis]WHY86590.1 GntR family transcriptional regulator [Neobacillus novalis]
MNIPLNHTTLSDRVAKEVRKMILNGTLQPGERINEVRIAEQMNISRGPLREGLRMLQNEGLVKHETNKGTFVSTLSTKDAWEIYTLRALLEGEAAQLSIDHISEKELHQLERLIENFHQAIIQKDIESMENTDRDFHQIIVAASKHKRLQHMHQQLDIQLGAMFFTMANSVPIRVNSVVKNHQLLVDVLRSKDKERVKHEFSNHYTQALSDLLQSKSTNKKLKR